MASFPAAKNVFLLDPPPTSSILEHQTSERDESRVSDPLYSKDDRQEVGRRWGDAKEKMTNHLTG
jgi:hypothetical protein